MSRSNMAKKYIDVDLLRKEIERRKNNAPLHYHPHACTSVISELEELLSFLDTLSEEPDKSLEEAITEYYENIPEDKDKVDAARHFAEWQQEQKCHGCFDRDEVFMRGMKYAKEQMMEEAVEGEICGRVYDHINVRFADGICKYLEPKNISHIPADVSKYNIGDKVRIVVLKEEEE